MIASSASSSRNISESSFFVQSRLAPGFTAHFSEGKLQDPGITIVGLSVSETAQI